MPIFLVFCCWGLFPSSFITEVCFCHCWCLFLLLRELVRVLFGTLRGGGTRRGLEKKGCALCLVMRTNANKEHFWTFNVLHYLVWLKLRCQVLNCFPKEAKLVTEERISSGSASVYPIAASFSLSCTCHSLVPLTAGFLLDAGSEDVQRRRCFGGEG